MSRQIFSAAGLIPGFRTPVRDWQTLLGTEGLALSLPFLAPTGTDALAVHCPLGCGCAHEVVSAGGFLSCSSRRQEAQNPLFLHTSADQLEPRDLGCYKGGGEESIAVCVCEDGGGCPDILLPPGALQVLELRVEALGREAARALNCRPLSAVIDRNHLWQIGTWSAEGVPVLMTLNSSEDGLARAVELCAARFRSRIILLADDLSLLNAHARAMLDAAGSGIFGLSAVLRQSAPGRLQFRKPPEELFCAFTSSVPEEDTSSMQKAFALLQKLESKSPQRPPGLATIFKLYCMDELPAADIARKCGCSKTTIIDRLARIRRATGLNPAAFRAVKQ